jgi:pilus assembly protein CpaB
MDKKALLISVAAAIVGVALLQVYLRRYERETSGGAKVLVLVAAQDIAPGTVLRSEFLGSRGLPQAYLDQRHVRVADTEKVLGAILNTGVKANESLLWTDLATMQASGRTLSSLVQEGMRAFAVKATTNSFSGLLRPGDRVDVLYTAANRSSSDIAESTTTIVQNLLVLAAGMNIGGKEDGSRSSPWSNQQVTLSVTAEQAQLLTQADHQGSLSLTVRNPNDIVLLHGLPKTTSADVTQVVRKPFEPALSATAEPVKEIEHVH